MLCALEDENSGGWGAVCIMKARHTGDTALIFLDDFSNYTSKNVLTVSKLQTTGQLKRGGIGTNFMQTSDLQAW